MSDKTKHVAQYLALLDKKDLDFCSKGFPFKQITVRIECMSGLSWHTTCGVGNALFKQMGGKHKHARKSVCLWNNGI